MESALQLGPHVGRGDTVDTAATRGVSSLQPLSRNARAVYHLLSQYGPMSLPDAESALSLSRPKLIEAVKELRRLLLLKPTDDGLAAVPHNQVIDSILTAQADMVQHVVEQLNERQRQLRSLIAQRQSLDWDGEGKVQALSLTDSNRRGMYDLPATARHEISAIHPGGQFSGELLERSLERAEQSIAQGVRLRVIHQTAALAHQNESQYMRSLEDMGGRVRVRDNLPFRLLLIDDSIAVCSLPAGDGQMDTFMLEGSRVVNLLRRVFEVTWIDATPLAAVPVNNGSLPPRRERSATQLTPQQESILRLLAEGQTDQSIARALGITTRTVTRRIAEIYEILGVDSRFQAGAEARRQGMI